MIALRSSRGCCELWAQSLCRIGPQSCSVGEASGAPSCSPERAGQLLAGGRARSGTAPANHLIEETCPGKAEFGSPDVTWQGTTLDHEPGREQSRTSLRGNASKGADRRAGSEVQAGTNRADKLISAEAGSAVNLPRLAGCAPWPTEFSRRYRAEGLLAGRLALRQPDPW